MSLPTFHDCTARGWFHWGISVLCRGESRRSPVEVASDDCGDTNSGRRDGSAAWIVPTEDALQRPLQRYPIVALVG